MTDTPTRPPQADDRYDVAAHWDDPSPNGTEPPGESWAPVDLGPYLRGEIRPAQPSIGVVRSDGLRMLYPGKEHTIIGEMESGKSWFLVACCIAELINARPVVYIHFEEADPTDTIGRLRLLGAPDDALLDWFTFVGPDEPADPARLAALVTLAPSLVVLDGVNEAMSMHGMGIREEDGAAAYRRRLIKPFTAAGAATLSADHVVKDREKRGRDPLGSIHKGNGLTGSLLLLENAEPMGRGLRGRSHLYVTKDRPGWLRRHGRPDRKIPGKTYMGELVVDDTTWRTAELLTIWAPKPQDDEHTETDRTIDDDVFDAVAAIAGAGIEATTRKIRAKVPHRAEAVADALERLVLDGDLDETTGSRNARVFTISTESDRSPRPVPVPVPHTTGNREPVTSHERSPVPGTSGNQSEPVEEGPDDTPITSQPTPEKTRCRGR